ncbi:MAG: hypothetical protein WAM79_09055 [Candidatus Sulfotelmatobacter sp.]
MLGREGRGSAGFAGGNEADVGLGAVARFVMILDAVAGAAMFGRPGSRWTPSKNSRPSRRQFRATAENCSRCHLTVNGDPT